MDAPYQAGPDIHVLPTSIPLPGAGVLTINAYVLHAEQPVLIDGGIASDGAEFVDALASVIDPASIRWVWLTHDDADHTGNIERVLELAPAARLVTNAFAALRLATWATFDLTRVHAIRPGDKLDVGDRALSGVRPPLFDNPMSLGIVDGATGALFSVDSFGAMLPEPAQEACEVPRDALVEGMVQWATFDSPWAHVVDRRRFAAVIDGVRRLAPSRILSSHLPAADGTSLESFLDVLASVPDAEPSVPPDADGFAAMVAAMQQTAAAP